MRDKPNNYYDLAIVDPPYGLDMGGNAQIMSLKSRPRWEGCKYEPKKWDSMRPPKKYFSELFRASVNQIIWGGNYYTDHLPVSKGWVMWDKKMSHNNNFSHGELAWTSFNYILRIFYYSATGTSDKKIHPTQKPVQLYRWLLSNYAKEGDKILDTHGGSFSSAIACHNEGYDLDICELDEDYFNDAVKRFKLNTVQGSLF